MLRQLMFASLCAATAVGQVQADSSDALFGEASLSAGSTSFVNPDAGEGNGTSPTLMTNALIGATYGNWIGHLDFDGHGHPVFFRDYEDEFDEFYPEAAFAVGLHLGHNWAVLDGDLQFGGFYGQNFYQSDDSPGRNDFITGDVFGLEAEYSNQMAAYFGQAGYAGTDDDSASDNNEGFMGYFARLGTEQRFDLFTLTADWEIGYSGIFYEDEGTRDNGQWGVYNAFALTADLELSENNALILAFEQIGFQANDEDAGSECTVMVIG